MKVFSRINEIRNSRLVDGGLDWGLVPTMGDLQEGHLSLIRKAKAENNRVAVSILVNPIQFNSTSDLQNYPRNMERDLELLIKEAVDLVWTPNTEDVYPSNYQTYVEVDGLTKSLGGELRPTHFKGVTIIAARLLNIFIPERVYFGQKDSQQVLVVKKMINDLNFPVDMVICPTIREADGLAMS